MIVRMFQRRFAPLVKSGQKKQTIRAWPKRMPKIGESFSARRWRGKPYRSKQELLILSVIVAIRTAKFDRVGDLWLGHEKLTGQKLSAFAKADGFDSAKNMLAWFERIHGLPFIGIVIYWK